MAQYTPGSRSTRWHSGTHRIGVQNSNSSPAIMTRPQTMPSSTSSIQPSISSIVFPGLPITPCDVCRENYHDEDSGPNKDIGPEFNHFQNSCFQVHCCSLFKGSSVRRSAL